MSPEEAFEVIRSITRREREAMEALVLIAKGIVMVLKDHGAMHSVLELEAQLVAIESIHQERI